MMSKLNKIFKGVRIVGLAGLKNSGKTNNLISLIVDYRKTHKEEQIFAFGLNESVMNFLSKKYNVIEISSLRHLVGKKDCLIILDEFQRLKLNDRRNKDELDEFIDFVYHNNVYVILSSPNIREFNSIIGGVIEKWLLKSVRKDNCINGSQLKRIVEKYKGRYKLLGEIEVPVNELLVINDDEELKIKCKYIKEADHKLKNKELF